MKGIAPAIACLAGLRRDAAWLAGCQKGTLGDPDAGGVGRIMGVGARGASGIGGAGVPTGGIGGGFGGGTPRSRRHRRSGANLLSAAGNRPCVAGSAETGASTAASSRSRRGASPCVAREECDGNDLGVATCAAAGFGSGKLVCADKLHRRQRHGMFGVPADGASGGQLRRNARQRLSPSGPTPSLPPTARSGLPRLPPTIPTARRFRSDA